MKIKDTSILPNDIYNYGYDNYKYNVYVYAKYYNILEIQSGMGQQNLEIDLGIYNKIYILLNILVKKITFFESFDHSSNNKPSRSFEKVKA